MAYRFRLNSLSKDEQRVFQQLEQLYPGLQDYIEKNGRLPDDFAAKTGLTQGEINTLTPLLSKIPSESSAYQGFLKTQGQDEWNLTRDELNQRLEAYRGLSGLTKDAQIRDIPTLTADIKRTIGQRLEQAGIGGITENAIQKAAELLANRIANSQGANLDQNFAEVLNDEMQGLSESTFGKLRKIGGDITISTANALAKGEYMKTIQVPLGVSSPEDINRIEDLIKTRQDYAAGEATLNQAVASLPAELARGREDILKSSTDYARQQFSDQIAPSIMQNLNARGILNSGDFASELNRGAGEAYSAVQQQQQELEANDASFYQSIAYEKTLRDELNAGKDVSSSIRYGRDQSRQNQEMNFQRTQAELGRTFNEQLQRRQAETSLAAERAKLQREQDRQRSANRNAMISSIGQSVGAIGGAIVGGPVGSVVGSQVLGNVPTVLNSQPNSRLNT